VLENDKGLQTHTPTVMGNFLRKGSKIGLKSSIWATRTLAPRGAASNRVAKFCRDQPRYLGDLALKK